MASETSAAADRDTGQPTDGSQSSGLEQLFPDRETEQPAVSIVLPTYNEHGNLRPLVDELAEVFGQPVLADYQPYEVLVVDGGSADGTRDVIRSLVREADVTVTGIFMKRRFGQSAALQAGFDHACGDIVVPMDADGQNNPADIPRLLDRLADGYDAVNGWRQDRDDPWHKTLPSMIQTPLAKLTGPDINDYGCTLAAYRREAVQELNLRGEQHRYIPSQLHRLGYQVTEVPVDHRPREHGTSRYGLGRLVRGFADLLYHVFWSRYGSRPVHLLGGFGLVLMTAGGTLGLHALVLRMVFGVPLLPRLPRLVLVAVLLVFGLQLVVFGVIAEQLTSLQYEGDREYRIDEICEGGE